MIKPTESNPRKNTLSLSFTKMREKEIEIKMAPEYSHLQN